MKTKNLLLVVVVALLLLGGWYLWGPSGGSATSLNGSNFAQFTAQFDGAAGGERLLVLSIPDLTSLLAGGLRNRTNAEAESL